jgi:hypothetical protein
MFYYDFFKVVRDGTTMASSSGAYHNLAQPSLHQAPAGQQPKDWWFALQAWVKELLS